MKQLINRYIIGCSAILVVGCSHASETSETAIQTAVPVTISPIHMSRMSSTVELSATSNFMFKASIKSPMSGYINEVLINFGDKVTKNQRLFTLKSKEASALASDSTSSLQFSGIIHVNAVNEGVITSIEHPKGDYVVEGDALCQIADLNSFVFLLEVPYEMLNYVHLGESCDLILPDNQTVKAIITSNMPSMSNGSQTVKYILKLAQPKSLPENLVVRIRLEKEVVESAQSLSKSAILTDETMHEFWVMKLINDSMAVKISITPGITTNNDVEIKEPHFLPSDKFLTSGNYGLGDTAYIKVKNQ